MAPYSLLAFLALVVLATWFRFGRKRARKSADHSTSQIQADTTNEWISNSKEQEGYAQKAKNIFVPNQPAKEVRPIIEPLVGFDLDGTKPLKFRPFKPIYYITMGNMTSTVILLGFNGSADGYYYLALQSSSPSDLIIMDANYEERVLARRQIIANNPNVVMGSIPEGTSAVRELYTYVMQDYLPARYPAIFRVDDNSKNFHNTITKINSPLAPPKDPLKAFSILAETVEDDMFLLHETEKGHRVVAFVCCHPSGFDPSAKLGLLLKDVHTPVPSYDKIGASMERFFSRLEVGKNVRRMNVSCRP